MAASRRDNALAWRRRRIGANRCAKPGCLIPRPLVISSAHLSTPLIITQALWCVNRRLDPSMPDLRRQRAAADAWAAARSAQHAAVLGERAPSSCCRPCCILAPCQQDAPLTRVLPWCSISRGSTFSAARSSTAAASASRAASTARPSPTYSSSVRSSYRAPSPSRAAAPSSSSSSSSSSSNSSVLTNNFYFHQNRDVYLGPGVPVSPLPDASIAGGVVAVPPADASPPSQYDTNVAICVTLLCWFILLAPFASLL